MPLARLSELQVQRSFDLSLFHEYTPHIYSTRYYGSRRATVLRHFVGSIEVSERRCSSDGSQCAGMLLAHHVESRHDHVLQRYGITRKPQETSLWRVWHDQGSCLDGRSGKGAYPGQEEEEDDERRAPKAEGKGNQVDSSGRNGRHLQMLQSQNSSKHS